MAALTDLKIIAREGNRVRVYDSPNFEIDAEVKVPGIIFFHFNRIDKFTKQVYEEMLEAVVTLQEECKKRGISKVYSLIENTPKICKLNLMLGFEAESYFTHPIYNYECLVMSQEIV